MRIQKALRTAQHFLPGGRDGREVVSRVIRRLGRKLHEPDFAALRLFPSGQLFLDVGANYGQTAASMRLLHPEARIVSYEPNTELAAKISELFRSDAKVAVKPIGLSDTAGQFDLYVPYYGNFPYPGLASLSEHEARSWLSSETLYFFRPENVHIKKIQCRIGTLDEQQLAPYFIKIDVQGAEFEMLQGGATTLRHHHPILLIESPGRDPRIAAFLASLGYQEFEFVDGRFLQRISRGTNSFFLTADRQAELRARHTDVFDPGQSPA
jgi:FkbM family methyltransferase